MVKKSITFLIIILTTFNAWAVDKLDLLDLHNEARGRNPLQMHLLLDEAAQGHADWMAKHERCSHTGANNSSPFDRIKKENSTAGENVAAGFDSPKDVMKGWMSSSGHKANILNKKYKFAGFGIATSKNGTVYWCACFTD